MASESDDGAPLPRALALLWGTAPLPRRSGGLSRERIVAAAVDIADVDGLGALSMARLADRLGCGTMSLYRHVANKDELLVFMLSAAADPPPAAEPTNWRAALRDWADGLWQIYQLHPWILDAGSAGPPADPGQLAWLDAGLAALATTGLSERDKFGAVMAVLHFVRGAAALANEAGATPDQTYSVLLRRVVGRDRFPALAAALDAGVFDHAIGDPAADFQAGLAQLLDGVAARVAAGP